MEVDKASRGSWLRQASSLRHQPASTTSYKANQENIELPVRRKHHSEDIENEDILPHYSDLSTTIDGSSPQSRKIIKSFQVTTRPFGLNYTVSETTKKCQQTPTYFIVSTEFRRNTPDLILHEGSGRDGHRMAIAYFRFSRHIRLGFGSEAMNTGEGVWEEMRNTSSWFGHARYEFEYNTPDDDEGDFKSDFGDNIGRTRKKFVWERTRQATDGVKGVIEQNMGWRNYRLLEVETGTILAVMLTSMFSACWNKGVINLHKEMSQEMEVLIILSAMCICDKAERRIRHYTYGRGGGGP